MKILTPFFTCLTFRAIDIRKGVFLRDSSLRVSSKEIHEGKKNSKELCYCSVINEKFGDY